MSVPTPTGEFLRLYGSLFENSTDGVILGRPDGSAIRVNPAACRMLQRSEAEVVRVGRSGVVVDDDAFREWAATRESKGVARGRLHYRRGDGTVFPVDVTSAVFPSFEGELRAYVIFRDLSEEEERERQLREATRQLHAQELDHARLQGLEGRINEIELVMRLDGSIVAANDRAVEAYGYTRDELRARTIGDLRAEPTRDLMAAQMAEADERGIRFETDHQRKDGSRFPVLVSSRGFDVGGERYLHSLVQDLTEPRALQAQLQVASRLAALGTLVAGVVHEVNNPLAGQLASDAIAISDAEELRATLRSAADLDREALRAKVEEILDCLQSSQAAARRIAQIVRRLHQLGQRDPHRHRVRLAEVLAEAAREMRATMPRNVTLAERDEGAPEVMASAAQIGQVLVNLITNAAQSIPEGRPGTVTVTLGRGRPGMARIEVSDDGVGLPPGVLERIFDPFFTTRDVGKGSGLGLPICHAVVAAHGGTITASSTPQQGSTFRVELPEAG